MGGHRGAGVSGIPWDVCIGLGPTGEATGALQTLCCFTCGLQRVSSVLSYPLFCQAVLIRGLFLPLNQMLQSPLSD